MNQYPLWKNVLIGLVCLVGAVYALPNLYGEDPALQVSAARGGRVDEATRDTLVASLEARGYRNKGVELSGGNLLIRFGDTETQLQALDAAREQLGPGFTTALNLAPATPDWLRGIRALPMYLGLDLRGGVHFLLEADMEAAVRQSEERYVDEFRGLLREAKIRYQGVTRAGDGVEIRFREADAREKGEAAIRRQFGTLLFESRDEGESFALVTRLSEQEKRDIKKFAVQQNITTLRNRVNELGVAEPIIQQQGEGRIVVQLPGVQDTAKAKEILGATATLEYRLQDTEGDVDAAVAGRPPVGARLYRERNGRPILLKNQIIVTGDQITDASSGIDQQTGQPAVFVTLDGKGARRMSEITRENIGKPMAVVFIETKTETRMRDGQAERTTRKVEEVISVATIRDHFSKRFQTTGLDSPDEARTLALLLRAGALATPMQIIEERTVGPSLGKDNIAKGFNAALIGFVLVVVFMVVYYRVFGIFAAVALTANLVLMVAILSMLQATLTVPGIAGIVLTVGMAVDANVLIYERVREELRNGNTPQAAISAGYDKAFGTIADANITTLIAAIVLFGFGTGPIKGFAVTLSIGILTSMFTAIMVSRALANAVYGGKRVARLSV